MAAGNHLMKEIYDQFLVCKICFELYKRPKTLSCLHAFCLPCLEKHQEAELERSYTYLLYSRAVSCPICRKKTEVPAGGMRRLPDNHLLDNLASVVSRRQVGGNHQACEICRNESGSDQNEASAKCLDCFKLLCSSCVELHKQKRVTANHNIFDIEVEKEIECKVHPGEVVRFYCEQCEVCVCVVCTFQEHKNHEISSFHEGMQRYKACLDELINMCNQRVDQIRSQIHLISKCEGTLKKTEEQIKEMAGSSISEIKIIEGKMIEELYDSFGSEALKFLKEKDILQKNLESLQSTCGLTDIVAQDRGVELLLVKHEIQAKINDLLQDDLSSPPAGVQKKVCFMPGSMDFGKLSVDGEVVVSNGVEQSTASVQCGTGDVLCRNCKLPCLAPVQESASISGTMKQYQDAGTEPVFPGVVKVRSRGVMVNEISPINTRQELAQSCPSPISKSQPSPPPSPLPTPTADKETNTTPVQMSSRCTITAQVQYDEQSTCCDIPQLVDTGINTVPVPSRSVGLNPRVPSVANAGTDNDFIQQRDKSISVIAKTQDRAIMTFQKNASKYIPNEMVSRDTNTENTSQDGLTTMDSSMEVCDQATGIDRPSTADKGENVTILAVHKTKSCGTSTDNHVHMQDIGTGVGSVLTSNKGTNIDIETSAGSTTMKSCVNTSESSSNTDKLNTKESGVNVEILLYKHTESKGTTMDRNVNTGESSTNTDTLLKHDKAVNVTVLEQHHMEDKSTTMDSYACVKDGESCTNAVQVEHVGVHCSTDMKDMFTFTETPTTRTIGCQKRPAVVSRGLSTIGKVYKDTSCGGEGAALLATMATNTDTLTTKSMATGTDFIATETIATNTEGTELKNAFTWMKKLQFLELGINTDRPAVMADKGSDVVYGLGRDSATNTEQVALCEQEVNVVADCSDCGVGTESKALTDTGSDAVYGLSTEAATNTVADTREVSTDTVRITYTDVGTLMDLPGYVDQASDVIRIDGVNKGCNTMMVKLCSISTGMTDVEERADSATNTTEVVMCDSACDVIRGLGCDQGSNTPRVAVRGVGVGGTVVKTAEASTTPEVAISREYGTNTSRLKSCDRAQSPGRALSTKISTRDIWTQCNARAAKYERSNTRPMSPRTANSKLGRWVEQCPTPLVYNYTFIDYSKPPLPPPTRTLIPVHPHSVSDVESISIATQTFTFEFESENRKHSIDCGTEMTMVSYVERETNTIAVHTISKIIGTESIERRDQQTSTVPDITAAYVRCLTASKAGSSDSDRVEMVAKASSPIRSIVTERASSPIRQAKCDKAVMASKAELMEAKEESFIPSTQKPLKPSESMRSILESIEEDLLEEVEEEEHHSLGIQTDTPPRSPRAPIGRRAFSAWELRPMSPSDPINQNPNRFFGGKTDFSRKGFLGTSFMDRTIVASKMNRNDSLAEGRKDLFDKSTSTVFVETSDMCIGTESTSMDAKRMQDCISKLKTVSERLGSQSVSPPVPGPPTDRHCLMTNPEATSVSDSEVAERLSPDENLISAPELYKARLQLQSGPKSADNSPLCMRKNSSGGAEGKTTGPGRTKEAYSLGKHLLARKQKPQLAQLLSQAPSSPEDREVDSIGLASSETSQSSNSSEGESCSGYRNSPRSSPSPGASQAASVRRLMGKKARPILPPLERLPGPRKVSSPPSFNSPGSVSITRRTTPTQEGARRGSPLLSRHRVGVGRGGVGQGRGGTVGRQGGRPSTPKQDPDLQETDIV